MAHLAGFEKMQEVRVSAVDENRTDPATYGYDKLLDEVRGNFLSGKTRDIAWRKQQLQQVLNLIKENHDAITGALNKDLGGSRIRGLFDLACFKDAKVALNNVEEWAAPKPVAHGAMLGKSEVRAVPKGVVLILSPWNFPVDLLLSPIVACIASGNCAIIKPSEVAAHSGALMEKLIHQYLDNDCFRVVQGAVPETTALLKLQYDHILYTGNGAVASIVMKAASKYITPVTLELGGKSPVIIDNTAKLSAAAERILLGKFTNVGQICIAPDYILVHKDVAKEFKRMVVERMQKWYGDNPKDKHDLGRMINAQHLERVKRIVDSSSGTIIYGGTETADPSTNYLSPTIIDEPSYDDPLLREEIFGPALSIKTFETLDEAIATVNKVYDSPLAMYVFSENTANIEKIFNSTQSGSFTVNTTIEYNGNKNLPFGGVGKSGIGYYHGKWGFDELSHFRGIYQANTFMSSGWLVPGPPYPDWLYDLAMKAEITGFVSDSTMRMIKIAAAAGLGFVGYRYLNKSKL